MASLTGGRFLFQSAVPGEAVTLGIKLSDQAPVFPDAVAGNLNIEVFVGQNPTVQLDPGFQDFALDLNGTLSQNPAGFLTGEQLQLGNSNLTLIDSVTGAPGQSAATIAGGSGNQTIFGAGGDVLVGGSGDMVLNAITQAAGTQTIIGGSGNTTVFAGAGDVVTGASGSGQAYIDGTFGQVAIQVGSGTGTDIIIGSQGNTVSGSAGADTITGASNAVNIQGLGTGDVVNLSAQTGNATINALVGGVTIALGSGAATVFGGAGDTVIGGSGAQYIDAGAGTHLVSLGSGGTTQLFGSSIAGGGNTVLGGAGALNFNIQNGGGDLINLSGSTGAATINASRFFAVGDTVGVDIAVNDTILAGSGGNTVFGGAGDLIGVGDGSAGTDLFTHATTLAGAIVGFGTFDADSIGGATVQVGAVDTGGGNTIVGGFDQANDFIFYQNENATDTTQLLASATDITVDTIASVQFNFFSGGVDTGTTMTLIGVTNAQFQANGGFLV